MCTVQQCPEIECEIPYKASNECCTRCLGELKLVSASRKKIPTGPLPWTFIHSSAYLFICFKCVPLVFTFFPESASDIAKIFMLTRCVYVCACVCIPCMVLSYLRPHNNLSTCATGCLLTVNFCYFRRPFPSIFFSFLHFKFCQYVNQQGK